MVERANMNIASRQGFTLVEMAIVLVIVGLLVGMGAAMIGPLSNMARNRETKDTLEADSQAITSWASANNSIPNTANFASVAKTTSDAWGRPIVYLNYSSLARVAATKDTICGRRTTPLTVTTRAPVATIPNVAFILLSGAGTSTPQSTLNGSLNGATFTGGIITASGNATGTITQDAAIGDILRWVTLDELRSKVGCQGAPLKIVNNELPFTNVGGNYLTTLYPDGGVGNYKWCIQSTSGTLPGGIIATPSDAATPFLVAATCPTSSYVAAASVKLAATPVSAASGSYSIIVNVTDADNNSAQKPFVITINPN